MKLERIQIMFDSVRKGLEVAQSASFVRREPNLVSLLELLLNVDLEGSGQLGKSLSTVVDLLAVESALGLDWLAGLSGCDGDAALGLRLLDTNWLAGLNLHLAGLPLGASARWNHLPAVLGEDVLHTHGASVDVAKVGTAGEASEAEARSTSETGAGSQVSVVLITVRFAVNLSVSAESLAESSTSLVAAEALTIE